MSSIYSSTQTLLPPSKASKQLDIKTLYDSLIFNNVKERLLKNNKNKIFKPSQLSMRRNMLVNLAFSKLLPVENTINLTDLQIYHTVQLHDQNIVKKSSNIPLYDFLIDFQFWDKNIDNIKNTDELKALYIIEKDTFIRYFSILSYYIENEAIFERNITMIFMINSDDMLTYIKNKQSTSLLGEKIL